MIRNGSVWERLRHNAHVNMHLTTGSDHLDGAMAGGLSVSTAYEANGGELTGKTTWCLQCAVEAVSRGHHVVFLNTNNTPVREIVPDHIDVHDCREGDSDASSPGISVRHVFTIPALISALHAIQRESSGSENQYTFVIIDALTPLLAAIDTAEDCAEASEGLRVAFFQLKSQYCWIVGVTNGDRSEMDAYMTTILDGLFDATITFSWHGARHSPPCGPSARLIRSRHGAGSVKYSAEPIQLAFSNLQG